MAGKILSSLGASLLLLLSAPPIMAGEDGICRNKLEQEKLCKGTTSAGVTFIDVEAYKWDKEIENFVIMNGPDIHITYKHDRRGKGDSNKAGSLSGKEKLGTAPFTGCWGSI